MSFLTDDAKLALEEKFKAMNIEETPPAQVETKVETRADSTVSEQKDENRVDASSADKEESGHAVPYQRFKEVNNSKKQLQAKAAQLEQELQEMRAKLESRPKTEDRVEKAKPSIYDDYASIAAAIDDVEDEKYTTLSKRLETFEVRAAQAELESEIAQAQRKYPDVPETVLLQAVIQNPDTSVMNIAKEYSQFIAEIEERALAKHAKKTAPAVPPRPQSSGTGVISSSSNKPRTMSDARAAALAFLKTQGL